MAVAVLLLSALPVAASAQTVYVDRGVNKSSGESGVSGQIARHVIPADKKWLGVTGFKFYMLDGETSGVFLTHAPLPGRQGNQDTIGEWYTVGNHSASDHNVREVSPGPGYFITGVRVCTQDVATTDQRSIRGVKLRYARIKANGTIVRQDDPFVWVNKTGCDKWEERASCPSGHIAVGFRAHKHATSGKGFRALGLVCSPVEVRNN
jgi:hypothetical protein